MYWYSWWSWVVAVSRGGGEGEGVCKFHGESKWWNLKCRIDHCPVCMPDDGLNVSIICWFWVSKLCVYATIQIYFHWKFLGFYVLGFKISSHHLWQLFMNTMQYQICGMLQSASSGSHCFPNILVFPSLAWLWLWRRRAGCTVYSSVLDCTWCTVVYCTRCTVVYCTVLGVQ